jgi:tripartite-type tricarboxylate transporter receptor subunit TctC
MCAAITGRRGLLLLGAALGTAPRATQANPTVPLPARALVGFAPGGPTDTAARLYADALRGAYAPHVLVENRAGAGGRLAVEAVKVAAPDGTALLMTPGSVVTLQPHVYPRQVKYDALVDLAPVGTLCTFSVGIAVPSGHPAKDLREFAAWARVPGRRGVLRLARRRLGPHFIGGRFGRAVGARLTHVPYRGAAPALQDLLGGRDPDAGRGLSDLRRSTARACASSPCRRRGASRACRTCPPSRSWGIQS